MSKRIYKDVKENHYPTLVKKLVSAKMLTLLESDDDVIENSVFRVWKEQGKSQRLIWSGNRSNLLFNNSASAVELPIPDVICSLFLEPSKELCVAGCDILQYYNRLRAPQELIPLLGLPKIRAGLLGVSFKSGFVTLCLTCVPMGATFSVALAQAVTCAALPQNDLPVPESFHFLLDSRLSNCGVVLPYINDITSIGTSCARVNRKRDRAAASLASVHLTTDPKKGLSSDDSPYQIALGLAWWKDGEITVKPSHALRLFRLTNPVVASKRGSPAQIRRIVGLWTYALLLRRPEFSILYDIFLFLDEDDAHRSRCIPDSVVSELATLLHVFPLLFADLSQPMAPRAYFSAACPHRWRS